MKARRLSGMAIGVASALGLVVACGSGDGGGATVAGGTGGHGASSSGGSGAGTGTGGSANGTGFDAGNVDAGDSALTADSACANVTVNAERVPVALYIMLDKSGSMNNGNRWENARAGLQAFVNDPGSQGLKVALQFFSGNGPCNGSTYDTPAVPMDYLSNNGAAIMASINGTTPGGGTPTEGALRGISGFCRGYTAQHPQEKCVGLLVTDGQPQGCDTSSAGLSQICSEAFNGTPSLPIFMMGMQGASFQLLDELATAAGTGPSAFNISSGGADAFAQALQNVAGQLLSCDYAMPTTDAGTVNPASILINFTDASGTSPLGRVSDVGACGPSGGFYYDDPTSPTRISLCPASCDKVQGADQGSIEILLDCTKLGPA